MRPLLFLLLCLFSLSTAAQMPNTLSNADKIYGLSKFWQEVNYNFVYLNQIDRDKWEQDYKDLIVEVQETTNDYEYYRLLQKFCATLKDGHTDIFLPNAIKDELYLTNFGEYRFIMSNIDGRAIVTRINLSKKEEIPVGTEVIKVNGQDTRSYLEQEVVPYISSSTNHILMDRAVFNMFQAPKGTSFDITFKFPDGTVKTQTLTHEKTEEEAIYPAFPDWELLEFEWLEDGIAYVSLNSFSDPEITKLFIEKLPELYKAKKLVIDLRKNGGGNTNIGKSILEYLTNDAELYGSRTKSRLHIPSFKAWGSWMEAKDTSGNAWATQAYESARDNHFHQFPYQASKNDLDAKRLVVPTTILIGHNTASAAEDFLILADNQEHMTKIGEATFGSTGQPIGFKLPGGGSARVCTKKDTYPDGREFVGYGVFPDIEVKKTYKDYLNDHDPVLERAIGFLRAK